MLSEGWLVKKVSYLISINILFLVCAIYVNYKTIISLTMQINTDLIYQK